MTKNKVLNFISLFILVPMLLLSLFVAIPNKKRPVVYGADEVVVDYSFIASDLYNIEVRQVNGYSNSLYTVLFSASCYTRNGEFYLSPKFKYTTSSGLNLSYYDCTYFRFFNSNNNITWQGSQNIPLGVNAYLGFYYAESDISKSNFFMADFSSDVDFNCNVYKTSLYLSDKTPQHPNGSSEFKFLNIQYFDVNENWLTFSFYVPKNYEFNSRVYYFIPEENITEDQYYQSGYDEGVADGYEDGYNAGLQDNQELIYNNGFNAGYEAGFDYSNDYSFNGLLGAVIDVPVNAFTSLLNFEVLGINILGFISGLLTLALIIFIVKVCVGGK